MGDISEAEAILHLKRALGEIDAGDAVPAPLPPVARPRPTPPAKLQKTTPAPAQVSFNQPLPTPQIAGQVGPSPGPAKLTSYQPPQQSKPPAPVDGNQAAMQAAMRASQQLPQSSAPIIGGSSGQHSRQQSQQHQSNAYPPPKPQQSNPFPVAGSQLPGRSALPAAPAGGLLVRGGAEATGSSAAAAAAAAALAAAGPGKSQIQFEIPQAKVGMIIGKGNATLDAIKGYSKAQVFVEQHTPDDEKARLSVIGTSSEMEKCKQTILAVVDGTLSLATLFSLAGKPLPAGGPKEGGVEPSPSERAAMANRPQLPGMPGLPGMGVIPGMPENMAMQANLNDYYARWWSTYSSGQPVDPQEALKHAAAAAAQARPPPQPAMPAGPAFDAAALQRLAEKAKKGEAEPTPMFYLPGQSPGEVASRHSVYGAPPASANDPASRASLEVQNQLNPPAPSGITQGSVGKLPSLTLKGFLRPGQDGQKSQKDDDSVAKMLERLQGNAESTKEAVKLDINPQMRMARVGQGTDMTALTFGIQEDTRTRADFEFEALMGRMQAAQAPDDVDHIKREFLIKFRAFSPQQAVELVQKLDGGAASQLQSDDFIAELARMLVPRLREFSSTQFTSLTSTFASWKNKQRGGGRFADLSKSLFHAASTEMSGRLMEFAPHEINMCLAAFVSVGFNEHRFFASVGRAALARHSSFAPVQLTAMLAILSEMRLVHTDLFNAAASFLSLRAQELRPVDIVRVLRSFAKCNVQHQGLCRAVSDEVTSRSRHKGTASGFSAEDLCEISWTLCILQHYHEGVFRSTFRAMQARESVSAECLCQLYEVHLVLDAEHKDSYSAYRADSDEVEALIDNYREFRKDERRCSERHRSDVASALKSLVDGSVHVNHRTSTGLLVDVAALRKRSSNDGFIHVDLDTNVTSVRSLDQETAAEAQLITEGAVALRRRVLQKHGFRLVTVKESEWRELDDSKEKRRYLRGLLQNLGDILT